MTTQQVLLWSSAYFIEFVVVMWFSRATSRRILGASIGGVAVGCFSLVAIVGFEALGMWRVPMAQTLSFRVLFFLGLVISSAPVYLVTWRIARRFGGRGLAIFIAIVAVIGPPRDYLIGATFPNWMVFSPGIAPVLADSVTYLGFVALGHAVMRVISGPATADPLALPPKPIR
jgi:hypothetical protein